MKKGRQLWILKLHFWTLYLAWTEGRFGMVTSNIVELDAISIKVVQNGHTVFVTHTVIRLRTTVSENVKFGFSGKFPSNHATLPSGGWPVGGRSGSIGPSDSPGPADWTSGPEIFQGSDQVVGSSDLVWGVHRWRSHSVASTVVIGPLPWKVLARHMKSISAPKIQIKLHFEKEIEQRQCFVTFANKTIIH